MLFRRVPWWIYVIAAIYVLTFGFNARQEFWGPANAGVLSWPAAQVGDVSRGRPMERAGVRAGDVLLAANHQPVTGMPDWFVVRAHFELHRPIDLRIQRGGEFRSLTVVITEPAWRAWSTIQLLRSAALYLVRCILLLLAIYVGFSRPEQLRARLLALMFAIGAVAEGFPSPGWAAALGHWPAVLAVPICLATASCLLSSLVWLAFFADLACSWLWQGWQRTLVLVPGVIFGGAIISSAIALIYFPEVLARPWPQVLSATPVGLIEDIAGVAPLIFFNALPAYRPGVQVALLDVWFGVTILYLTTGSLILALAWHRSEYPPERRRLGALCFAVLVFGVVVAQNLLERNWLKWFGTSPPIFLSTPAVSLSMYFLFLPVPLILAHYVLTGDGRAADASTGDGRT
jgi:hypothetical protein